MFRTSYLKCTRESQKYDISEDGISFKQMRICHMWEGAEEIHFDIYTCSPEQSSF